MRQLYAQGLSGRAIAAQHGYRSASPVYRKLSLGRPPRRRWTNEELQILVDGYAAGKGPRWVARKVGRSPRGVSIRMCRYRKEVRSDPKKRRTLRMVTLALRALRRADIYRELEVES